MMYVIEERTSLLRG